MMPPDETFIDELVTPAPVFAYRALKGFIFGSPEDQSDIDYSDKENTPLDKLEVSKRRKTTTKARTGSTQKSKTSKVSASMPVSFSTPQSKHWEGRLPAPEAQPAPSSPTRSILRVPGQATPRSQSMKDVNVTFKELSPEEAITARQAKSSGDLPPPSTAQPAVQTVAAQKENKGKRARNVVSISTPATTTDSAAPPAQVPSAAHGPARIDQTLFEEISREAIDKYSQKTEREVKRLIARAKKLRDYAYQADLKNQELKKTIKQLEMENRQLDMEKRQVDMENEMLRNGLHPVTEGVFGRQHGVTEFPFEERLKEIRAVTERRIAKSSKPLPLRPVVPLPKNIDPNSELARRYKIGEDFLFGDPTRGGIPPFATVQQLVEAYKNRPKINWGKLLKESEAIANSEEDSELKKAITHPKVYAMNKARADAARERLAKKSEARKASLEK